MQAEILTSNELHALGSGINVCCNSALQSYTTASSSRLHPSEKKEQMDALQSCVTAVSSVASNHCSQEYDLMKSCLDKNQRSWVQCEALKRGLDLCLVKHKAGELV
mmetsp:Transcript_9253/g.17425  ORF Transcript_9253/g.17425 Transcript_9253/m.17425 type:complete len:106 (+) Transcript_9253:87-404(+)